MSNGNFKIVRAPKWEYEVVCLLVGKFNEISKKNANSCENSDAKNETALEGLEQYNLYKEITLEEIMDIFNSKYKILEQFFIPNQIENPIIVSFVLEYILKDYNDITDSEIDEIIFEMLRNIENEYITNADEKEYDANNIVAIINMLNKTTISDKAKMQIINYYNDRYNLSRITIDLIKEGAEILKKHFCIIENDFIKSVEILEKTDDLFETCRKIIGLRLPLDGDIDVYTIIFNYSQLSVHSYNEDCKKFMCFIGMYIFDLYEMRKNWKMNDTKIITSLKALSDATRYKIIFLLSKQPMYLQELSDQLNLTPATISHHTNVLLRSNLISITMDAISSKKIYYEVNKEKLLELSDLIRDLAE